MSEDQEPYDAPGQERFTWNHRVIEHFTAAEGRCLMIHEVHYIDGKPSGYTVEGAAPLATEAGEDDGHDLIGSLRWTLEQMMACLEQPVLAARDFTYENEMDDGELDAEDRALRASPPAAAWQYARTANGAIQNLLGQSQITDEKARGIALASILGMAEMAYRTHVAKHGEPTDDEIAAAMKKTPADPKADEGKP